MTTYPELNKEQEILSMKTRDDEIKELKYQTETHDHENMLKSPKIDNDYYKKKYRSLKRERVLILISEILYGSGSAISTSTMSLINPSVGIVLVSSSSLLASLVILITNEYISNLRSRYTKLRDWISFITILYEKTIKESMIVKKNNQKEAEHLKQIYNH